MLAQVTNRARGARGFETRDRGTVLLEPGETMRLDLSDHPLHRAWEASGEVSIDAIAPAGSPDARPIVKRPGRTERKPA